MGQDAGDEVAKTLVECGFHPRSTPADVHPTIGHLLITRPVRGSRAVHRTLTPLDTHGRVTPARRHDLVQHGSHLDSLPAAVDYERIARDVYDEVRNRLSITGDPGFTFSAFDFRTKRPAVTVEIAANEWEREGWPLHATFGILDHEAPLGGVRRFTREILRTRQACAVEAARQAAEPRIVERTAAIVLAHALRDERAVVEALRSPAAWPRIVHVFSDSITTRQEQLSTPVEGLPGASIRVSAKLAWLTTCGPMPGGLSWTGTTFQTAEGTNLAETIMTAIPGYRLSDIVDHPWLRGIQAPIIRAAARGPGLRARLALKTASDRIDIDAARDAARRIIDCYEHVPLPPVR